MTGRVLINDEFDELDISFDDCGAIWVRSESGAVALTLTDPRNRVLLHAALAAATRHFNAGSAASKCSQTAPPASGPASSIAGAIESATAVASSSTQERAAS